MTLNREISIPVGLSLILCVSTPISSPQYIDTFQVKYDIFTYLNLLYSSYIDSLGDVAT